MTINGLQKLTLLDYPGKVACTIFFAGCNFRCPFCHNASLVLAPSEAEQISEETVLAFLKKRQGVLDGVCITGENRSYSRSCRPSSKKYVRSAMPSSWIPTDISPHVYSSS